MAEPNVIDVALLRQQIGNDNDPFESVTIVRFDFQNILKIDSLWMLTSLTKLSLAHNRIGIIENLEELINLKELDLSFNEIDTIQNLDSLVDLRVLMLNNNAIVRLENMDALRKLTVLSVSGNRIIDYKQATYLRQFENLKTLSIRDNPCCSDKECYTYLKAVLPQMVYLDYAAIAEKDRSQCVFQFRQLIGILNEQDEVAKTARRNKEIHDSLVELYTKAFVENFDGHELFEIMFKSDSDGYVLLNAGKEIQREYEDYKINYVEIMKEFIESSLTHHYLREDKIKEFTQGISDARNKCVDEGRKAINNFFDQMNNEVEIDLRDDSEAIRFRISLVEESEDDRLKAEDGIRIYTLWKKLMLDEMTLYEQSEKTKQRFIEDIQNHVSTMINESKSVFDSWRIKETEWITTLEKYFSDIIHNEKTLDAPEMQDLLSEQDVLFEIIRLSKENHMQFISDQEELFSMRIKDWLYNLIKKINRDEILKNRSRVLEITQLIEKLKDGDKTK